MFLWKTWTKNKMTVSVRLRGQRPAHCWQTPLSYHRLVLLHLPRAVSPKTKYTSLECVVNKWLSITSPAKPQHFHYFIVDWLSVSLCEYQAVVVPASTETISSMQMSAVWDSSEDSGGRIGPLLSSYSSDRCLHLIYAQCYFFSHHLPFVCVSRAMVLILPTAVTL